MDPRGTLRSYPYVVLRVRCDACGRGGGYRLATLVEKFGANFPLDQLVERLAYPTCARNPGNRRKGKYHYPTTCEARLPDLEPPMKESDLPAGRDPHRPHLPFKRGNEVYPDGPYWRATSVRRSATIETIRLTGSTVIAARRLHCKRQQFLDYSRWPNATKIDAIEQRLVCMSCKCRKVELIVPGQPSIEDGH